jgi:predicted neuraminidase
MPRSTVESADALTVVPREHAPLSWPVRAGLMVIAVAIGGFAILGTARPTAPAGVSGTPTVAAEVSLEAQPIRRESWVSPEAFTPSAHSGATCLLPSGELMAVWFGGSREGARDVSLFTARYDRQGGSWTAPVKVVDRASAQVELGRSIRKVGNALLFPDQFGTVWLVYVTVTVGGWSGSALNVKSSRDDGRTWTESERLTLNPLFNFSSLVRNKPIYAADGRIGVPIYHEFFSTYPQVLWLTPGADGRVADYRVQSFPEGRGLIQPAVVAYGENRAAMFLRDHTAQRRLRASWSDDGGWTWSTPVAGTLPNPDAAVDALRLRDGRMLLAYNDASQGRDNLRLAVSSDEGRTWQAGPYIEREAGSEFSYPHLTEDPQGRVHLTYTWKRQRIKHLEFNPAWLRTAMEAKPR